MLPKDAAFAVRSGEGFMRTLLGRDASTHAPGDHFDNTVALATVPVREARGLFGGAELGPGAHTRGRVEVQLNATGTVYALVADGKIAI